MAVEVGGQDPLVRIKQQEVSNKRIKDERDAELKQQKLNQDEREMQMRDVQHEEKLRQDDRQHKETIESRESLARMQRQTRNAGGSRN